MLWPKRTTPKQLSDSKGELSPIILKVKSLIEQENKIGRVLSSCVIAVGGTRTREWMTEGPKYCTRSVVGGNIVTIGFDHMIDFVMLVLGELSEFADHIMLQGTLNSGAPLSVTFRRGPPFMGTPGFIWSIHGERGEIRIMAAGPVLQADDDETNITVHSFDQEDLEVIEWDWHSKDLARPARNVAPMYEAFASQGTENYPDFSHAVLRHRLIEEVYKSA